MWSIRGETIYTQPRCKVLTQCQFLERERGGGGWGHLSAKSRQGKNYKISVKSVQSALSDLLTASATHGTFSRPSAKRGFILIGLELNANARESFEHCWSYSLNLSIHQHVCHFASWHVHCEFFLSRPFPGLLSVIRNN